MPCLHQRLSTCCQKPITPSCDGSSVALCDCRRSLLKPHINSCIFRYPFDIPDIVDSIMSDENHSLACVGSSRHRDDALQLGPRKKAYVLPYLSFHPIHLLLAAAFLTLSLVMAATSAVQYTHCVIFVRC